MMEKLRANFQNKKVEQILDVGTGPGHFVELLNEVFPQAQITGVDPDSASLDEAREKYSAVNFMKMKGEQLTFPDDSFDLVTISMALHHLSDIQKTLKEMMRVAKPGGWILVNELYSDGLNQAQNVHTRMHHFRSRIDRMNGIVHNEAFTRKQIIELLEESGVQIELYFDYKKTAAPPSIEEIAERKGKLHKALETVKDRQEFSELAREVQLIEAELDLFGFEMAPRLVVVTRVRK